MNGIDTIIKTVGDVADDLITTKEEKLKAELEYYKLDADLQKGQMEINKAEAQHKSIFVAGWRPAVGWVCVLGLGYQFILYPLTTWIWTFAINVGWMSENIDPPGEMNEVLIMELLFGMLGLGAYRTYEKQRGVSTNSLSAGGETKTKKGFWIFGRKRKTE